MVCAGAGAAGAAQTLVHVAGAAGASEARKAGAGKGAHTVLTGAPIQAWVGITVIDVLLTGRASVPAVAGTAEAARQVGAGAMGATGRGTGTFVHILLTSGALPAGSAGADSRLAGDRLTVTSMLTGVWGARGQHLTLTALQARGAGAAEAESVAGAGAPTPAGLGLTGVSGQALAAAWPAPARLALTAEPARRIVAHAVTAGFVGTGMTRGEAERGQGAGRTEAVETIFPIHAGTSVAAGIGRTFVDFHVAKGPCEARLADTVVTVDAVAADSKGTRVADTVIDVDLTVHTCGAWRTATEVFVH